MSGVYTTLRKHNIRLWRIWYRMNRRCGTNEDGSPVDPNYKKISVCDEWSKDISGDLGFINFYDDMITGYTDDLELDRIDPFGNYQADNCRWATRKQQMNNTRWHTTDYGKRYLEARKRGLNRHTIYSRLERGWSVEDAFTLPIGKKPYKTREDRT